MTNTEISASELGREYQSEYGENELEVSRNTFTSDREWDDLSENDS